MFTVIQVRLPLLLACLFLKAQYINFTWIQAQYSTALNCNLRPALSIVRAGVAKTKQISGMPCAKLKSYTLPSHSCQLSQKSLNFSNQSDLVNEKWQRLAIVWQKTEHKVRFLLNSL